MAEVTRVWQTTTVGRKKTGVKIALLRRVKHYHCRSKYFNFYAALRPGNCLCECVGGGWKRKKREHYKVTVKSGEKNWSECTCWVAQHIHKSVTQKTVAASCNLVHVIQVELTKWRWHLKCNINWSCCIHDVLLLWNFKRLMNTCWRSFNLILLRCTFKLNRPQELIWTGKTWKCRWPLWYRWKLDSSFTLFSLLVQVLVNHSSLRIKLKFLKLNNSSTFRPTKIEKGQHFLKFYL